MQFNTRFQKIRDADFNDAIECLSSSLSGLTDT